MRGLGNPIRPILALLAIFLFSRPAEAKYSGGSGTAEDPYQIATAEDLIALGETPDDYDKHFILTADIDLAGHVFDKGVIAPPKYVSCSGEMGCLLGGVPFVGVFDGNGHTISYLTIKGGSCLGLFGWLAGEVKNLGVVDVNVSGSGVYVGGLVGLNEDGAVIDCYTTGAVSGNYSVGGLVGSNGTWISRSGVVTGCYSTGAISAGSWVGGLVGENYGTIATSYSTAAVSGDWAIVGGLVGANGGSQAVVTNCYSTGAVRSIDYVGGLVGDNSICDPVYGCEHGTVEGSFWDTQTSGQAASAGGTGKTTAEMQISSTFTDAGWDFVNVWGIGQNQTYPYLRRYSAADINQDDSVNFLDLAALAENWLTEGQ